MIEPGRTAEPAEEVSRPIRVCMVAPSLEILGGQAVQAARMLERFRVVPGLDVSFLPINPRLPGPLHHLQKIKYLRTLLTETAYVGMLASRLWKYDIIHIFSASYFSFVLAPTPALMLAKLYGKRTVLNYRSGEAEDHLRRWRRTAIPTIRLADELVVPSGYLVDIFETLGLPASAVFNTVDFEQFRFRRRDPLHPVFFANRNFESHYAVGTVLRAFARIQNRFPEASLVVAGDGPQRSELHRLADTLGLRQVDFVGRVNPERMGELYNAADIYLNGSEIDNMPGSILEAFAAGLPVVTTNAGGIPYIVTHEQTGLLVGCGDHAAMAVGAVRLLEDQDFATGMISRAHAECQAKYSWEAVRNEWLVLYRDLMEARPAATRMPGDRVGRVSVGVEGWRCRD